MYKVRSFSEDIIHYIFYHSKKNLVDKYNQKTSYKPTINLFYKFYETIDILDRMLLKYRDLINDTLENYGMIQVIIPSTICLQSFFEFSMYPCLHKHLPMEQLND